MQGVEAHIDGDTLLFHISEVSQDLFDALRSNLSRICFSEAKSISRRRTYSYKNTVREFLKRYDNKTEDTKIGMIGELLVHILLLENRSDLHHASPFFNLEERSIKKGFDLILFDQSCGELWITEVKSGQLHKGKDADGTCNDLILTAKRDLQQRLGDNETSIWENAINGAMIKLDGKPNLRTKVLEILNTIEDATAEGENNASARGVILAAGLFSNSTNGQLNPQALKNSHRKISEEAIFHKVLVLAFQKDSFNSLVDFLRSEVV